MREQEIDWMTVEEEIEALPMCESYLFVQTRMRASNDQKKPSQRASGKCTYVTGGDLKCRTERIKWYLPRRDPQVAPSC